MADNINDIIDVEGSLKGLNTVIEGIVKVETEIENCNQKTLKISIDATNLQTLQDIVELQKQQQAQIDANTAALKNNAAAAQQVNTANNTAASSMQNAGTAANNLANQTAKANASIAKLNAQLAQTPQGTAQYRAIQQKINAIIATNGLAQTSFQKLTTAVQQNTKAVQSHGLQLGKTTIDLEAFLTRMGSALLRVAAYTIVIGLASKAMEAFYSTITENIKGTDAYIKKSEGIIKANEATIKSFQDLEASYDKLIELQHELSTTTDNSAEGLKRQAEIVKAIGVVNRNVYEYEKKQLDADNAVRAEELKGLQKKYDMYDKLLTVISKTSMVSNKATGQLDETIMMKAIKKAVPIDVFNVFQTDLIKSEKESGNTDLISNLQKITELYTAAKKEAKELVENNKNATKVAEQQLSTKQRLLKDTTELDTKKELLQVSEKLRIAGEEGEAKSVDTIVADAKAKYALLYEQIDAIKKKYLSHFPSGYTDENIERYDRVLVLSKEISRVEEINNRTAFRGNQITNQSQYEQSTLSGKATLAGKNAAFGLPNYERLTEALDAETTAKKNALRLQHDAQVKFIDDNFTLADGWAEKQKQLEAATALQVEEIEKESFKKRLGFAEQYFNAIADKINKEAQSLQTQNATRGINRATEILGGRSLFGTEEFQLFQNQIDQRKTSANIGLTENAKKKAPLAEAYTKADLATKGALSPQALEEAEKVKAGLQKDLDDLANSDAKYHEQIAQADYDMWSKKREMLTTVKDLTIDLARQTLDSLNTIRDNDIAKQQQKLEWEQRSLQIHSQQKIAAINATAGYQIAKDNEVAKVVAQTTAQQNAIQQKQNELALKKARADKEAAEANIILNTALSIAKVLPMFAGPQAAITGPIGAAQIALITAIGAAQYAAAASTPLPQFFMGGTTETPVFRAGEKGRELGITPDGNIMMFNKDAAYTAPIGTTIKNNADTEKIINYAINSSGQLVQHTPQMMTDENIIKTLKELKEATIAAAMVKQPIKNTIIVNNSPNPLQRSR